MSDLAYAPPAFVNEDGQEVIFVDFIHARYRLEFDVAAHEARAFSEIRFRAEAEGLAVISMNQPVLSACLNGRSVTLLDQYSPDGAASFQILSKPVSPGEHILMIESGITQRGPYGHPITWLSDPARVDCVFNMSDLRRSDGGYLESFLPSNLNFDHFRMSFSVVIENSEVSHSIFSNGASSVLRPGRLGVEFPSYFTSCCPWFHLGPSADYQSTKDEFSSSDGRSIAIYVYARSTDDSAETLRQFAERSKSILEELQSDFGPFPHRSITVFARGHSPNPMEYAGAAATDLDALRHELDHSYFARSIIPANGDAGWIDEAIAKWGDRGYPRSDRPPACSVNMGGRSPYVRTTSDEAYTVGCDFLAYLDYVLADGGGLKRFLALYASQKRRQSVTTLEFQELVEEFHGASLQELFEEYVYKVS